MLDLKSYLPSRPSRRYKMGRSRASSLLSNYSRESEVSPERTQLWENDEAEPEENRCYFEDEEYETTRVFENPFADIRTDDPTSSDRTGTNSSSGKAMASDVRSKMSSALRGSKKRPRRMSRYGVLE